MDRDLWSKTFQSLLFNLTDTSFPHKNWYTDPFFKWFSALHLVFHWLSNGIQHYRSFYQMVTHPYGSRLIWVKLTFQQRPIMLDTKWKSLSSWVICWKPLEKQISLSSFMVIWKYPIFLSFSAGGYTQLQWWYNETTCWNW